MSLEKTSKICDFFIRAVILAVSFVVLIYLATIEGNNKFVLVSLASLYLLALIVKGIVDFFIARKK